jgi:hypothetical protein
MISKDSLLAELAKSRAALRRDWSAVGGELNVANRARRSVKRHPLAWLGAAAAIGYLASGRRSTAKTPSIKATSSPSKTISPRLGPWGLVWNIAKLLVPVIRPALSAYAAQKLGELATKVQR